jgi:excisionase family DNA binding protein
MNKRQQSKKVVERRPLQAKVVRAKRDASAMATVEDLCKQLGIGRNQGYELVQTKAIPSLRFGRRYLIPRTVLAKLVSGELPLT